MTLACAHRAAVCVGCGVFCSGRAGRCGLSDSEAPQEKGGVMKSMQILDTLTERFLYSAICYVIQRQTEGEKVLEIWLLAT